MKLTEGKLFCSRVHPQSLQLLAESAQELFGGQGRLDAQSTRTTETLLDVSSLRLVELQWVNAPASWLVARFARDDIVDETSTAAPALLHCDGRSRARTS